MNGRSRVRARRGGRPDPRSVGEPQGEPQILASGSLEDLAEEWDDLALRTGAPPFARPGWMRAWWSAFGARGALHPERPPRRQLERRVATRPLARRFPLLLECPYAPLRRGLLSAGGPSDAAGGCPARERARLGPRAPRQRRAGCGRRPRLLAERTDPSRSSLSPNLLPYVAPSLSWKEFEESLPGSRRQNPAPDRAPAGRERRACDRGHRWVEGPRVASRRIPSARGFGVEGGPGDRGPRAAGDAAILRGAWRPGQRRAGC